ncbi:uncharacterized protein LOC116802246 [Drosophila sechellia]|uniref:uncharacterized protein LOC116802246 n=1 Tax=Drosophila sechellia TaxID=7238 RepID=UPI0013DE5208|nr:uncharacterized protein LOC116802246 [Drosophila sechellia]
MCSIEWFGSVFYYIMRTYMKVTVSSYTAPFPSGALAKIVHFIDFVEVSMTIMRRPRNFTVLTDHQARRLHIYNCLLGLRTWAKMIYVLISVLSVSNVKTHFIIIAMGISGIFMAVNRIQGRIRLRPALILFTAFCCVTWVPWFLDELIN